MEMTAGERLNSVRETIARAAEGSGRDPSGVTLVAVSKTRPIEDLRELYDLGVRDFGESRLQEALPKIAAMPDDVRWHFIGVLQSNKARKVAESFHLIHTLASEAALREIAKVSGDVLIEVDLANEAQKSGVSPEALDALASRVAHYGNVHLRGLMTIGPAGVPIERMREIFRDLKLRSDALGLSVLSMGMSADTAEAVMEGATHVRVGTLLFGPRPQ